ncbi:hypothetical protein GCM10009765_59250 [Fodinicola feengrottensis]|uniref:Uncharacterized protein n=2 Tax=Fodinicola feengrottensis TaxID=435914 RepID=A0ABP4UDT1_9ACTN
MTSYEVGTTALYRGKYRERQTDGRWYDREGSWMGADASVGWGYTDITPPGPPLPAGTVLDPSKRYVRRDSWPESTWVQIVSFVDGAWQGQDVDFIVWRTTNDEDRTYVVETCVYREIREPRSARPETEARPEWAVVKGPASWAAYTADRDDGGKVLEELRLRRRELVAAMVDVERLRADKTAAQVMWDAYRDEARDAEKGRALAEAEADEARAECTRLFDLVITVADEKFAARDERDELGRKLDEIQDLCQQYAAACVGNPVESVRQALVNLDEFRNEAHVFRSRIAVSEARRKVNFADLTHVREDHDALQAQITEHERVRAAQQDQIRALEAKHAVAETALKDARRVINRGLSKKKAAADAPGFLTSVGYWSDEAAAWFNANVQQQEDSPSVGSFTD